MRCSRKSTAWFVSAWLALIGPAVETLWGQETRNQPSTASESEIRQAVVAAVKGKMGRDATVRIETLFAQPRATQPDGALLATPEPSARLGRPVRFALARLAGDGVRTPAGFAVATVFVSVEHARAARTMDRGETCSESDLVQADSELGAVLMQRLPRREDLVGARTLRAVAEDEVLTPRLVTLRPAVRSGDDVAIRANAGSVTVEGRAVATQSGSRGDVIRVVNKESRRTLKALVVGPGQVEVVQ